MLSRHGAHSIAFGWFLEGYAKSNAYGGWFVSDYATPVWVGVNNGSWTTDTFVLSGDSRLSNSRPASDVYSWAKASTKPSYSWSEIGSRPTALSQFTNDSGYIAGTADVSATANTIAKRDAHGYLYATYYN